MVSQVLVVSADDHLLHLLRSILESVGHDVMGVPDGGASISVLRQMPIDLIIADIDLSGKNGLGVIQELNYEFSDTKLIALVDERDERHKVTQIYAKVFGAFYVFLKPIHQGELLQAVQSLLVPPR